MYERSGYQSLLNVSVIRTAPVSLPLCFQLREAESLFSFSCPIAQGTVSTLDIINTNAVKPTTNFIGNSSQKATKKPILKHMPLWMSNSDNFQLTPAGFEQVSWKGFNLILMQVSWAIHSLTLNPGEISFFLEADISISFFHLSWITMPKSNIRDTLVLQVFWHLLKTPYDYTAACRGRWSRNSVAHSHWKLWIRH